MSVNDTEITASINLGVTNKFYLTEKFRNIEFMKNEFDHIWVCNWDAESLPELIWSLNQN